MVTTIILAGAILMMLGIVLPCLIWFIRNLMRIVRKKNAFWLSRVLKFVWLFGLILIMIGLALLISELVKGNPSG